MSSLRKIIWPCGVTLLMVFVLSSCDVSFTNEDPRIIETNFSERYKAENKGKARVEIPAAYELAQIAYTLAEEQHEGPKRAWTEGDYYESMLAHFNPYMEHEAVNAVGFWEWPDYWSFRQNSLAYKYEDGELTHAGVYETLWNAGENKFSIVEMQLERFARDSNFDAFYTGQSEFYAKLKNEFLEIINPTEMQKWLHKNFTARYDSYLIVISPLVGGAHNFAILRDSDYAEAIITISAPNVYDQTRNEEGAISPEARLKYARLIFTELDHNYVNPVSEKFNHKIKTALGDISQWNSSDDYRSAEATFNEYITWGIFPLFVKNQLGENYIDAAQEDINRVMLRRGFVRFPKFSQWILTSGLFDGDSTTVESSYPEIIQWFAEY